MQFRAQLQTARWTWAAFGRHNELRMLKEEGSEKKIEEQA
jgi:hypothetical protein